MAAVYLSLAIVILAVLAYYVFYLSPKLDPSNRAEEFLKQNKIQDAIIEYQKILEVDPFKFVIQYKLAELYLKVNENDKAAIHLEKILSIGNFNYEVEKAVVQKKLAHIYFFRNELRNTFEMYMEVLRMHPSDEEALYHVAFMALGQEEFDLAQRYFDKLVKVKKDDFDSLFGAGICSYQNQKTNDAVLYFKSALSQKPKSDIGNIAMIIALYKKRDFKQGLAYIPAIINVAADPEVVFLIRRIEAFLLINLKKFTEAASKLEELLEFAKKNDLVDEINLTLYDLGHACYKAEYSKKGYEYWNDLEEISHGYNNVTRLITVLRKEMDHSFSDKSDFDDTVNDFIDEWVMKAFDPHLLWKICGLKSKEKFDIKSVLVLTKTGVSSSDSDSGSSGDGGGSKNRIIDFINLDSETFRIMSSRVVEKLGYSVDQILPSYKESDGVDFIAIDRATRETIFVWVRRWKQKVGEIPLRNFAQAINDIKSDRGLLITTADFTSGATAMVDRLSKVRVIQTEELDALLSGLM